MNTTRIRSRMAVTGVLVMVIASSAVDGQQLVDAASSRQQVSPTGSADNRSEWTKLSRALPGDEVRMVLTDGQQVMGALNSLREGEVDLVNTAHVAGNGTVIHDGQCLTIGQSQVKRVEVHWPRRVYKAGGSQDHVAAARRAVSEIGTGKTIELTVQGKRTQRVKIQTIEDIGFTITTKSTHTSVAYADVQSVKPAGMRTGVKAGIVAGALFGVMVILAGLSIDN